MNNILMMFITFFFRVPPSSPRSLTQPLHGHASNRYNKPFATKKHPFDCHDTVGLEVRLPFPYHSS